MQSWQNLYHITKYKPLPHGRGFVLYLPFQPDHAGIPPAQILGARDIAAAVTGATFARSILQIAPQHIRMHIFPFFLRTFPVIPVIPGHILLIAQPCFAKPLVIHLALPAVCCASITSFTRFSFHAATSCRKIPEICAINSAFTGFPFRGLTVFPKKQVKVSGSARSHAVSTA